MASARGKRREKPGGVVWQDREIRFDSPLQDLALRRGEFEIDSINSVEDTKGNNGQRGALRMTNLRVESCALSLFFEPIVSFSFYGFAGGLTEAGIGYGCVQSISIRTTDSRIRGRTQALCMMTKYKGSRFEFVFTSLVRGSPRLFTTVQAVFRAYETSKLYRDLKLRGAIVRDGRLNQLPQEEVIRHVDGVWNLSNEQGNLGAFFITNVRIVWYARLAENFNVSIPFMQVESIDTRDSRFGYALVIETLPSSGGYMLGFRIDPEEAMREVRQELDALIKTYARAPIFGIQFSVEEKAESLEDRAVPRVADDVEIVDEGSSDALAAYYADSRRDADRPPVFDSGLGLAVEAVPPGYSLDKLWAIG